MKEEKQVSPFIEHHVPELQVSVHNVFLEDNNMVCIMKVSKGRINLCDMPFKALP